MLIRIFLYAIMVMILPLMYFIMRNEVKPKKNIVLGVTLSLEARESAQCKMISTEFRAKLAIFAVIFAVLSCGCFFFGLLSIFMTYLLCWLVVVMGVISAIYVQSHLKLKAIKKEFSNTYLHRVRLIDIKSTSVKTYSKIHFIIATIISLLPILVSLVNLDGMLASIFLCNLLIVGMFFVIYISQSRQRSEMIDNNTNLTIALTRIRKQNFCKFTIIATYLTAFFSVAIFFFPNFWGIMVSSILYTALLVYYGIKAEFAIRTEQQRLTENCGYGDIVDDDDNWILGKFYFNKDDNHFMVNDRIGMGMTFNLAKPIAKIIMVISFAVIVLLPCLGFYMIYEETTPTTITVLKTKVVIGHTSEFSIQMSDIQSVELLDSLPKTSRIVGTAMDELLKGTFDVEGYGRCTLSLNPQKLQFIVVKTQNKTYIVNSNSLLDTYNAYKRIVEYTK